MNSYYTTASIGQHLDLSLFPTEVASEDVYLRVIAMKSASAVECACHVGALLAEANPNLIESFTAFGHNLGMASQIANDIKGVSCLRDIKRHKITLPTIYALAQTDGEIHRLLENAFCRSIIESATPPDQIKDLLFRVGGVQYATIMMELYKQKAIDNIIELERAGVKIGMLKHFLEST